MSSSGILPPERELDEFEARVYESAAYLGISDENEVGIFSLLP
jgi:hypothetical protein